MLNAQHIASDIVWVGANDRRIEKFENIFPLENGVSYNSFIILDEKTAVLDTVDIDVIRPYTENIKTALNGRSLDYLVIHHMEPDHCAGINVVAELYPKVKLVGNAKTFQFFEQFYGTYLRDRYYEVKNADELKLGKHCLKFISAPMVHWPEVMMSYEMSEKILFSADAFGTFGALSGNLFDDEMNYKENYLDESRRYYANIVGKFGMPVQSTLKKMAELSIDIIAPLHGPILRSEIKLMTDKYDKWSTHTEEEKGVVLAYASMYGNTAGAVDLLANMLSKRGVHDLKVYDVSKTHLSYIIGDIFKYSNIIVASPTYNLGVFQNMESLLIDMGALNIQNKNYSVIGNGSWAPMAGKKMLAMLEGMKNMTLVGNPLEILSRLDDAKTKELEALADAVASSVK